MHTSSNNSAQPPAAIVAKDEHHLRTLVSIHISHNGPACDLNHIDVPTLKIFLVVSKFRILRGYFTVEHRQDAFHPIHVCEQQVQRRHFQVGHPGVEEFHVHVYKQPLRWPSMVFILTYAFCPHKNQIGQAKRITRG